MEIVFLTHKLPFPPFKGSQVKAFHLAKGFSELGYKVHLISPYVDGEEDADTARTKLLEFCESVTLVKMHLASAKLKAMFTYALSRRRPLTLSYFGLSGIRQAVRSIVEQRPINGFLVYSSSMAQYVPERYRKGCLIDMGDIDSAKWEEMGQKGSFPMSWVHQSEARRLRKYENWIVENFGATNLATENEIALLTDLSDSARRKVFASPNGTNIDTFCPSESTLSPLERLPEGEKNFFVDPEAKYIVFTGAMDYEPNVEAVEYFAKSVLPLILSKEPKANFLIVGGNPTNKVKLLGKLPNVRVTGFVQSTPPYFQLADVVVIPLILARGIQNKALEAMACGCGIVCTPLAAQGVKGKHEENMLLAEQPAEFAAAVLRLVRDKELAQSLGKNARVTVKSHFTWGPIMELLESKYQEAQVERIVT